MAASAGTAVRLRPIPTALIPVNISGTDASTTVVSGAAGQQIDVWCYDLYVNGVSDLNFMSGSTDISGALGFGASSGPSYIGWNPPQGSHLPGGISDLSLPRCSTATGEDLILTNSGAGIRVSGTVWITQRAASAIN